MTSLFYLIFVEQDREQSLFSSLVSIDEGIIEAFKKGDRKAFDKVFSLYREPVYRFIWKYIRNDETAMDLLQESFIRLLKMKDRIKPDKGLKNLLFTIARNLCFDELKKVKNRKAESLNTLIDEKAGQFESSGKTPEQNSLLLEMEDALGNIIDNLPSKEKEVLLMKRMVKMTYDEIADSLGFSSRYVKKLVKQALDKIIVEFEKAGFTKEGEIIL